MSGFFAVSFYYYYLVWSALVFFSVRAYFHFRFFSLFCLTSLFFCLYVMNICLFEFFLLSIRLRSQSDSPTSSSVYRVNLMYSNARILIVEYYFFSEFFFRQRFIAGISCLVGSSLLKGLTHRDSIESYFWNEVHLFRGIRMWFVWREGHSNGCHYRFRCFSLNSFALLRCSWDARKYI